MMDIDPNTPKPSVNQGRKILTYVTLVFVVITGIVFIWAGLAEEIRKARPVAGFEVFLEKKDICAITMNDNEIWAGGIDGLFVSGDDGFSEVGDFRQVKALLAVGPVIWVGHDEGLTILTDKGMTTLDKADGLPDERVNALARDSDGTLWAGTWGGAALIRDEKVSSILTSADGLIDDMVNVIYKDSAGSMWLGSYVAPRGGVTVVSKSEKRQFSTADGLLHSNINAIIEIADSLILTGGGLFTKGGGTLFSHDKNGWVKAGGMTTSDGIAGDKVRSLYLDSNGSLWVGSEYDGLAVFRDFGSSAEGEFSYSDLAVLTIDNGLPNNEVKVVAEAADGSIWIGTRSGLLRIDKEGMENVWGSD